MSALDPVLVVAIRECADWLDEAAFNSGVESERDYPGYAAEMMASAHIARATIERLLSVAP